MNPRDAVVYRPALVRFFRRKMRDVNDVEDLVQEVFVRIAARQGGEVDNLGGYVFQTAASVLADRHRRRTVRHADDQVPFDTERHSSSDFDAGRVAESRETLRAVVAALMNLPERTRTIFVLRRLEGQNYKDIAVQFGISVSAVEKQMVRAVNHLLTSPGCTS
ncbi:MULTISPECIES: RNA polymerase sigma factor [Sphingosinicellaceae]|uniref:RNA polymerase sigma factor n=1 Tax=Sphingosinicellaceae TaxID=2820280 RepID=UPI001C1DE3B3|nr:MULTISPECIES: RNA polymerase sigma factor [Polymorphobacter]QYE33410.1 RNA polymerase sigma factor [Polymorphobacter sp. PAMC 29334]UAJ12530.1 RNA polymerase sigma factor [Polymorphobacter megasporae]